jgi:hypothetical protein
MKPVLPLRIASILTFIHGALHTVGGVFGKPQDGEQQTAVLAMQAHVFPVMGVVRSYWSFYRGMGLAVSIFLAVEALIFWQISSLARDNATRIRPLVFSFLIAYVGLAAVSQQYLFSAPIVNELLIAACLGWALFATRPAQLATSRV